VESAGVGNHTGRSSNAIRRGGAQSGVTGHASRNNQRPDAIHFTRRPFGVPDQFRDHLMLKAGPGGRASPAELPPATVRWKEKKTARRNSRRLEISDSIPWLSTQRSTAVLMPLKLNRANCLSSSRW